MPFSPDEEGYIVEFITLGNAVKVTAIDTASGREVSLVATPGAAQDELAQLAVRKLKFVLEKEKGGGKKN
jgi:hypothetical protein